ncbi:MAG: TonB-dependent receptor domain-containing protein, partial [Gemmatimonadales bacterium]
DRFTGSGDLSWRPTYWLEGHATAGLDFTERRDIRFQATGTGPNFATRFQGDRISDSRTIYQYTLDVGATAQFQLSPTVSSKTTVAGQYFRTNVEQIETTGQILAPGAGSQKSASTQFIDEDFIESRTLGFFIEEALGFNERFFINGALRFDDNSAFGEEFDGTIYPKAGVSWVAQEGGGGGFLDNLRLRGAFGASGQQPGSNDATQFFTGISVIDDAGEQSGVRISNAGNANLKPERSTEVEVGFDAGLFANRVGLEFTYYNRTTTDALIERTLAPSIGLTTSVLDNIGETNNKGIELGLNMVLFDSPSFSWDMSISGSTNSNEIVTLGCQVDVDPCPAGSEIEPIIIGSQNQHRKGRPLGAWFDESFTFDDLDGDGIIEQNEITYSDTNEFIGYPRPRYEISFFNAINFGERLRVSGLFDYRGGHKQFNLTEAFRCGFNICQWINDPSSTLAEQAAAQTRRGGPGTGAAFIEDAWFIKLRELSFTFFFPQGFAEGLGMDRMNLTVTGRNLLTITDYLGADPEVQGQTGNFTGRDFLTQPQVRYWTARLNLTF